MSTVLTIETNYTGRPGLAAAYLLVDGDQAAFIENNTTRAVPLLMEALAKTGLEPEQVRYAIVTHVHLDHAGGSSALMKACSNATLLAHPRATRHLIDPTVLVASAKQVYGEAQFRELYGEIEPIPPERVRAMNDGERLQLGTRELEFFHTRGHANHHLCVHDSGSNAIFTGDAFGLSYPAMASAKGEPFAYPSTSPTDFDAPAAKAVVQQIAGRKPAAVYPTHYGEWREVDLIAGQLQEWLEFYGELFNRARDSKREGEDLKQWCREESEKEFSRRLQSAGRTLDDTAKSLLDFDLIINAQGIAYAAKKARSPKAS